MSRSNTLMKLTAVFTALAAAAFTAMRFVLLGNYDAVGGFYLDDAKHMIFKCGLAIVAVLFFSFGHIYNKKEEKNAAGIPETSVSRVVSYISGTIVCGFIVYVFARLLLYRDFSVANVVMAILSFAAMLYFFTKKNDGEFRAILCVCGSLLMLAMILGLYFGDKVSYINHSVMLAFAASIFIMLTVLAEANLILHRPARKRYTSYAPVAVILSFALSVPDIYCAIVKGMLPITDVYYDLLIFAFGLYHLATYCSVAFAENEK